MAPTTAWGWSCAVERLEDRLLFAHANPGVGEVVLPQASGSGQVGIEAAIAAPKDHRASKLLPYIEQDN